MPEFKPLFSYEGALSSQMITAGDLEFFLKSAYLSVQDHIIGESRVTPLETYFVTPPEDKPKKRKKCRTTGKVSFSSRGEAYAAMVVLRSRSKHPRKRSDRL